MKTRSLISSMVSLIIIFPFLILPAQTSAAPLAQDSSPLAGQTWERLGGPIGGLGYDIRMRPDNPDIMYVTDAWAGVHKSTDGGATWFTLNDGIDARTGPSGDAIPVFCLTIDPNNYDIIWIGMQNLGAVYRSEDGGQTWQKRVNGIVERSGLTLRGITVEPGNSDVVYVAGEISSWAGGKPARTGREFDMTQGVVYKSVDGGKSWKAVWRGQSMARYIIMDPNDHNILYVSTGIFDRESANSDPTTNTAGGEGVLKSIDGGETWTNINNGLGNLYVGSLFVHPQDPNTLLAATGNNAYQDGGGVYLTTDGGASWKHVTGEHVTSVEFSQSNPQIAYAAGDGQFYRSEDGGKTWKAFVDKRGRGWGPPGIRPGFPIDFQVDPRDPYRIFVNNYGGGNFLSEDGGETWITSSVGYTGADLRDVFVFPDNPAYVLANGRSGPFLSRDGGVNWEGINPLEIRSVAEGGRVSVDPSDPNHILLSSAHWGWTFESKDGGANWYFATDYGDELQNLPEPDTNKKFQGVQAITFAPSDPKIVYGGFGVWRCSASASPELCPAKPIVSVLISEDGGHGWTRLQGTPLDDLSVSEIVVHPGNPDLAWVSTVGGGIFRTEDRGKSWLAVNQGLGTMRVMDIAGDPINPDTLYAATVDLGVFKSEDGGGKWRQTSAGMDSNEPIFAITIDPVRSNVVYAGSYRSGVFMSEDGGAHWKLIKNGMRTRAVTSLSISADGETLYAGTTGEGVFRLSVHDQDYFDSLRPAPTPTVQQLPSPTLNPSLPAAQIVVDGNGSDWDRYPVSGSDPAGDQPSGSPDLGEIRAVSDAQYFYLYVKLHENGTTDHYDVLLDINGGEFDYQLSFWPGTSQAMFGHFPVSGMDPLEGVTSAQGDVIEVKMPLSAVEGLPVRNIFVQAYLGNQLGDTTPDLMRATILAETTPAPRPTGGLPCGSVALLPLGLVFFLQRRCKTRK